MVGYEPGNLSDRIKQSHFCRLLWDMCRVDSFHYFDLFAGAGVYHLKNGEIFEGVAMLALDMMLELNNFYHAYLNEKDDDRRNSLKRNVQLHGNDVTVEDDYQKHIHKYIPLADKNSLFFIDPTYLTDYQGEDGILNYLPDILTTEAKLFLYAPESMNIEEADIHKRIMNKIINTINKSKREFIDFKSGINNTRGYPKRIDHNIIIY